MHNDIIVKKPPASAVSHPERQEDLSVKQENTNAQPINVQQPVNTAKGNLPIGIIISALVICLVLVTITIYSAISRA